MKERYDLREMLEDIERDKGTAKATSVLLSQDEIEKMILERDSGKQAKPHEGE